MSTVRSLRKSMPHAPVVLRLVQRVDDETIEMLRELLQLAQAGEIVGLALAAQYTGRRFVTDMSGECRRSPVFARGMVVCLDDRLREAVEDSRAS